MGLVDDIVVTPKSTSSTFSIPLELSEPCEDGINTSPSSKKVNLGSVVPLTEPPVGSSLEVSLQLESQIQSPVTDNC